MSIDFINMITLIDVRFKESIRLPLFYCSFCLICETKMYCMKVINLYANNYKCQSFVFIQCACNLCDGLLSFVCSSFIN